MWWQCTPDQSLGLPYYMAKEVQIASQMPKLYNPVVPSTLPTYLATQTLGHVATHMQEESEDQDDGLAGSILVHAFTCGDAWWTCTCKQVHTGYTHIYPRGCHDPMQKPMYTRWSHGPTASMCHTHTTRPCGYATMHADMSPTGMHNTNGLAVTFHQSMYMHLPAPCPGTSGAPCPLYTHTHMLLPSTYVHTHSVDTSPKPSVCTCVCVLTPICLTHSWMPVASMSPVLKHIQVAPIHTCIQVHACTLEATTVTTWYWEWCANSERIVIHK